jgi:2-polyprenyl-3-methyl-5-hydroxy-6-metoxy-1,4-benzoquinol methylase
MMTAEQPRTEEKRNVDPKDIKRFNKQSKEWWDLNGVQHMLHAMNYMRVPWVRDGLKETSVLKKEAQNLEGCLILGEFLIPTSASDVN